MTKLKEYLLEWFMIYLPESEAECLLDVAVPAIRKYGREMLGIGIVCGVILSAIIVQWIS